MKSQKELEKIQLDDSKTENSETVAITFSPKLIIGILIAVAIIVIIVMIGKHDNTSPSTETTNQNNSSETSINKDNSVIVEDKASSTQIDSNTTAKEEKYTLYENGEMANISDANGSFKFGVIEATILKETGYRDAVYQITWITENEDYTSSLGTGTSAYDLRIVDSDGYIVEAMNSGWEGEWSNNFEDDEPKAGEKCKSKHTFVINNPECTYLDVSLEKYKVTCRISISNLENGISSIPEGATDKQVAIIKAAQSYVESCNMSYDGLVKQLEYEGYSHDEAIYGADNCGADWNEQAVKSAKSYLEGFNFSRDEMINQLEEGEGFTNDQAVYGADNCGKEW